MYGSLHCNMGINVFFAGKGINSLDNLSVKQVVQGNCH